MLSHIGIGFMHLLAHLPLGLVRGLGAVLGWLLFYLAVPRRRIALTNLALCFPQRSEAERRRIAMGTFIHFAQAWLDRSWLWHGSEAVVRRRLRLTGALHDLAGQEPIVIFAPHFVGLDAGWTGLALNLKRSFTTIYTDQSNRAVNAWILNGRQRFGTVRLFGRIEGVKTIVASLRTGSPLYLLPDMNFGVEESIWVPLYGLQAATVPSLSRFSRLGKARVVPVTTRLTPDGYTVEVHPAWPDFPTNDTTADTALMNERLEALIETMPDQYYWVHKRFKSRPVGEPSVY